MLVSWGGVASGWWVSFSASITVWRACWWHRSIVLIALAWFQLRSCEGMGSGGRLCRDLAIDLHSRMIESQTTVNLYRLQLFDLEETMSPELCTQLIVTSHKNCQLINSKLDLLQAYFNKEQQATSAHLAYFTNRNGNPTLHIHTNKHLPNPTSRRSNTSGQLPVYPRVH